MKNSKKKIVVSLMGLAMGAALVGSISGSVAWYQYSTRAYASMLATSAGTSRNLQIRDHSTDTPGSWGHTVNVDNKNLVPVTVGKTTAADAASVSFYDKPVYQHPTSGRAIADPSTYVGQYKYDFKVEDRINGAYAALQAKDVYVVKANINPVDSEDAAAVALAKAIRIHIKGSTTKGGILAKDTANTNLFGKLDIGGASGVIDRDGIDQTDTNGSEIVYGFDSQNQVLSSYIASSDNTFIANDSNPYAFSGGYSLGQTTTDADNPLQVNVTIWLEGWSILSGETASWDYATYISKQVKIELLFACVAE